MLIYSPIAQLVERLTVNQLVPGSSPGRGAKHQKAPAKGAFFVLSASIVPAWQAQIRLPASAFGATFPGPAPPSPRLKRSQSSARRAHPWRKIHPQVGPRVCLMRRHQLLLTTPLLLAPVPRGSRMRTHRCISRSRLLIFVRSLYPPNSVASLVTGSRLYEIPRTRIGAIAILTALLA